MKKLLFTLCAMMIAVASYAQDLFVATLTHGEDVSMFYGFDAFQEAMDAAEDGDLINLSTGAFNLTKIDKAVTIHGSGVDMAMQTSIMTDFTVDIPADAAGQLMMEGVQVRKNITVTESTSNSCFVKCRILGEVNLRKTAKNSQFLNCELNGLYMYDSSTAQFYGSYVRNVRTAYNTSSTNALFINCVIDPWLRYDCSPIANSTLLNCIVVSDGNYFTSFPQQTVVQNCISVGNGNPFTTTNGINKNNISGLAMTIFTDSDIMKDLVDEAKELYLGSDGTPVGMYGGSAPYNTIPGYPRITKMSVDSKASVDGSINVQIEVKSPVEP